MPRRKHRDNTGTKRSFARTAAAALVAGSIGFAVPALAAQPDNPSAHGQAQSQAHSQAATTPTATSSKPGHTKSHATSRPSTSHTSQSGSAVSLAKPNDFQAQADPDGMTNGGVDQPGGTGGVDTTTQDGNNGSGNDADCEDDNRGVGVPGHCKNRPAAETPETPATDDVPGTQTDVPTDTVPVPALGGVPALGDSVAAQLSTTGQTTTSTLTAAPGLDTVAVSAPNTRPSTGTAQSAAQAGPLGSVASVLPNTGAGQALLGLLMAAIAALVVGGGLLRQSRRTARVTS